MVWKSKHDTMSHCMPHATVTMYNLFFLLGGSALFGLCFAGDPQGSGSKSHWENPFISFRPFFHEISRKER